MHAPSSFTPTLRMATGEHRAALGKAAGARGPLGACCFILSSKEPLVLESLL